MGCRRQLFSYFDAELHARRRKVRAVIHRDHSEKERGKRTMKTSRAVWEKSLAALQEQMTPISYNTWITPIQPICIKDNTLVLQAEN